MNIYLSFLNRKENKKNKRKEGVVSPYQKLKFVKKKIDIPETTTVWIFDEKTWFNDVISNLLIRFEIKSYIILNKEYKRFLQRELAVFPILNFEDYERFNERFYKEDILYKFDYLAFICNDIRLSDRTIFPVAVKLEERMKTLKGFDLKEIVVISPESNGKEYKNRDDLLITHKYLLIYDRK